MDGPMLLWQLPWVLFRTHRMYCYCINQSTVFQGQSSILGNTPSHLGTEVGTESTVCTEVSVARAHIQTRAPAP